MKIAFGCDPNAQEFKMELMEKTRFMPIQPLRLPKQLRQKSMTEELWSAEPVSVCQLRPIR